MSADPGKLLRRALDALDHERMLLVAGRFEAAAAEAERRESLLERLNDAPAAELRPHAAAVEALRKAAARNARLLQAAIEGVAAGRRRVAEIHEARARLTTYDASGAAVTRGAGGFGRRA